MGIDRATIDQLRHLLRPIATRVANMIARGVVQLADDSAKMQMLQVGALEGETLDNGNGGAEHFEPYGFSSVPLEGGEAVVVFPSGDRSHPLVIAASDRRYRPTSGEAGQVTMYHYKGATVTMLENGNIQLQPGPGGQVVVDDGAGGAKALAYKDDVDALANYIESSMTLTVAGTAAGGLALTATASTPTVPPPSAAGTTVLKAK